MSVVNNLAWLGSDPELERLFEKLQLSEEISGDGYARLLACAILLIREYLRDNRKTSYFSFGYSIVLDYSIKTSDFSPLFDVAVNVGFYPVSKYILDSKPETIPTLGSYFVSERLAKFERNGIVETLKQKQFREEIVAESALDSCYVAPTSFGKSSMIIELIQTLPYSRLAVIVPTKSLLVQTYKLLNDSFPERRVIFHDEMFSGESQFIAVFTQERALRLLKKDGMSFDVLMVDEAHNLLEGSSRAVLLSRLIRKNRSRNPLSRNYYFSPLIANAENLKLNDSQKIVERHTRLNIKEPIIYEYRLDGKAFSYNRFLNKFFYVRALDDYFSYIAGSSKRKNFFYLLAPRKVQQFARELSERISVVDDEELLELSEVIAKNIHSEFYGVQLVQKGVLYLHGKLPDLIKEYLEYKFKSVAQLRYVVANTVILEGVNLPIDNLYILNAHGLDAKDLTNLIGRVNRLSEVFSGSSPGLGKLRPTVHFVNSENYGRKGGNMSAKIEQLRWGTFKDEVHNPTLVAFDFAKLDHILETSTSDSSVQKAKTKKNMAISIREREDFLVEQGHFERSRLKAALIESGIYSSYRSPDFTLNILEKRISEFLKEDGWAELEPVEKVFRLFVQGLEGDILDASFARLKNIKARDFYSMFVKNVHALSLKEHIDHTVKYFYSLIRDEGNRLFYIGRSFGEIAKSKEEDWDRQYIYLGSKSHRELVNVALIKIKMEMDFLSYKLNEYVSILHDWSLISEKEYSVFIYGTDKKRNAEFVRLGFSGSVINFLERDGQLVNLQIDELGHVNASEEFLGYLNGLDDLRQFEIRKYLS